MNYNKTIEQQLINCITIPTVLMTKDNIPYEFKKEGSINRLKRRRDISNIEIELFQFILENRIPKNQLQEFASGLFLNYVDTKSIYS